MFSEWPGDESLRIAAEPDVVVGLDESLPLDSYIQAVFFRDRIVIARMSREILILDGAGGLLSRHGRRGKGPGENSVLFKTSVPGFRGDGAVGPMEIRQPAGYGTARLSDGAVVFEGTRPGVEDWAAREVDGDGGLTRGGLELIFGRTAVSAASDRYAYLATTDSMTVTRYDEAGDRGHEGWRRRKQALKAQVTEVELIRRRATRSCIARLAPHPDRLAPPPRRRNDRTQEEPRG